MRELITMWGNTRMVVLTALTAALYAAVLIPFKVATIIPALRRSARGGGAPGLRATLRARRAPGGAASATSSATSSAGRSRSAASSASPAIFSSPWCRTSSSGRRRRAGADRRSAWRDRRLFAAARPGERGLRRDDRLGRRPARARPLRRRSARSIFAQQPRRRAPLGPVLLRLVRPRVAAWHLLWTDVMAPRRPPRRARPASAAASSGQEPSAPWPSASRLQWGSAAASCSASAPAPPAGCRRRCLLPGRRCSSPDRRRR